MNEQALIIGVIALLVVVAVVVWITVRAGRDRAAAPAVGDAEHATHHTDDTHERRDERPLVAVVVNPTKFDDLDRVKNQVDALAGAHGWRIRWWETTAEDTGTGQTREAVEAGAAVVCALGGDGTVRSVAAGLVGTDTPMGLLPGGTGNLLARNLELPIDSLERCFLTAITGEDKPIDVGRLVVTPEETQDEPKDDYFLVMAGLGFDASVMAEAPEKLKSHIGWAAYVVSGLKQLDGARFDMRLAIDDRAPAKRKARSIILGNVGRLQGGVELLPDALADDGTLDVVILAPKGITGWAAVVLRILTKTRKGHRRVEHFQCRTLRLDLAPGTMQEVQLDGDPIGRARSLTASVLPGALTVRVPPTAPSSTGSSEIPPYTTPKP